MIRDRELLESAKAGPRRAGRKELIKYLEGGTISRPGACKAKCFDCDGMGETGECDIDSCSLYPYSPYKPRNRAVSAKSEGKTTLTGSSLHETHIGKSQNEKETILEAI
jgi:hypothetical protein